MTYTGQKVEFPILHASYRKFCFYISCINPWKVRYLICHMLGTYVYTTCPVHILSTSYPRKCGTTLYQLLFAWHTSCPVPVLTTPCPRKCGTSLYQLLFAWHTSCPVPVLATPYPRKCGTTLYQLLFETKTLNNVLKT